MRKQLIALAVGIAVFSTPVGAQRRPLSNADIDNIATLLKLEDTRQFDEALLAKILKSAHPEVRRRAAISIGRINNPKGAALLEATSETDQTVRAAIAFAVGQLRQPSSVPWLTKQLSVVGGFPASVEAARGLGKIRTPEARTALANFLSSAKPVPSTAVAVGEALLSLGRFADQEDVSPVVRWVTSPNSEIRWRAAWALSRPRKPAALPHLFKLLDDRVPEVRNWAVRAFTPAAVDAAGMPRPEVIARLRRMFQSDPDRSVKTEALRTLLQYTDETTFGVLVNALYSPDSWIAVSAAEAAARFTARATPLVPLVVDVAEPKDQLSVRISALPSLVTLAPDAAPTLQLAGLLTQHESASAREAGLRALGRLGDRGKAAFEQIAADPAMKGVLPTTEDFVRRYVPAPQAGGGRAGGGGGNAGRGGGQPRTPRPDAEYRKLVTQFIVPDYNGAPKPRVSWDTPRGTIVMELYPGDAPFGVEQLYKLVESGDIVGTEFTRLVPDFVAQQQGIRNAATLRDEVNQRGLTRGNLSWASGGLDTGRPGYTLGHTPQPHNEGDFTALGRVITGMDAVDKLEIGDKVTGAKIVRK